MNDEATKRVAKDLEEVLLGEYQGLDLNDPAVLSRIIAKGAVMAAREVLGDLEAVASPGVWYESDGGWQDEDPHARMTTRGGRSAPLSHAGCSVGTKYGQALIICLACDTQSYHPKHVEHLYCPECDTFHRNSG